MTSFMVHYRTYDERVLAKIVGEMAFERYGEAKNAREGDGIDNPYEKPEDMIPEIVDEVMRTKTCLSKTFNGYVYSLDAKDIHLMGRKRVEEIVDYRVRSTWDLVAA